MKQIAYFLAIGFVAAATVASAATPDASSPAASEPAAADNGITMVIMDPLALPLSCPCVKGYAQRDYGKLGAYLEKSLHRTVSVVYNESLTAALKGAAHGQAQLVIGKHSVVAFDAKRSHLALSPVATLTGKKGEVTITGLVVVPKDDPAKTIADLKGYRIVLGPDECEEKHASAIALLKSHGVELPEKPEISATCSDGACSVIENFKTQHGAAVISSYARPLLEGCGTVEKGALRVVGETAAVPFIEAFINQQLPEGDRTALADALLQATRDSAVRTALETRDGFIPLKVVATASASQDEKAASAKKN
jgi:ABC-type phosphate/phosphonate transport system substrate-binding protein